MQDYVKVQCLVDGLYNYEFLFSYNTKDEDDLIDMVEKEIEMLYKPAINYSYEIINY